MGLPVKIITQPKQLNTAVQEIAKSKAIALDIESNSRYRYPEQLCLIQLATLNTVFIIDTILMKEINPLKNILLNKSITKVIHGADYDIRSLDRHYGYQIHGIFETTIAAKFTGITKFGLANLIKDLLGIIIEKSKWLQQANWGRRPLSEEALEYAANDVLYLLTLKELLEKRLRDLGRMTWVTEECTRLEELRYEPKDLETSYLNVKGANRLDGSSLAILKTLFMFREKEALRQHRPHYFIMPDSTLIYLATNPKEDLSKTPGLGQTRLKRFGYRLQRVLTKGLAAPPIYREPQTTEYISDEQDQLLKRLKVWRELIGIELSLDQSLIWPRVSLERLSRDPNTLDIEFSSGDIRHWQRQQFASSLSALLKSL